MGGGRTLSVFLPALPGALCERDVAPKGVRDKPLLGRIVTFRGAVCRHAPRLLADSDVGVLRAAQGRREPSVEHDAANTYRGMIMLVRTLV